MNQVNPAATALIRTLYGQALQTVKPDLAVRNAISLEGDDLIIDGEPTPLPGKIHVVAIGKAAIPMISGAIDELGERIDSAFALTKHGHGFGLNDSRLRVFEASHPVPDETTIRGTEALLAHVSRFSRDDVVLFLISGGGSAILEAPVAGITLDDMALVTQLMLRAGAPIQDLNAVRTPLSRVKGGGLRAMTPVDMAATLLLSDVLGNDPRVIASGPTVPSGANHERALSLIDQYSLRDAVPPAVLRLLEKRPFDERPSGVFEKDLVRVIADNSKAIEAIISFANEHRLPILDIWHGIEGEARERGVSWVDEIERRRLEPAILVGGGETTVTVQGAGVGGRNSEFAVAAAERLRDLRLADWTVASLASDGEDALTGAAGGIVSADSAEVAIRVGDDPASALSSNDTFPWIERHGEALAPGPTGTNVNDLYLAVPDSVAAAFAQGG